MRRSFFPGLLLAMGIAAAGCGLVGSGDGASPPKLAAEPVTSPPTTEATPLPTPAPTPSTTAPLPVVEADIAALADRTGMTDEARSVFYEADPQLVDRTELATACMLSEEVSVLGCFGPDGITILIVAEPRLDGMMETTAAHEMLHAAWARAGGAEREELAGQLQAAFESLDDPALHEKVELYRQADASIVDNELHSILGTEIDVGRLPAELETYYARWFTDRQAVVTLASDSQATLDEIEGQVDSLDAELTRLQPLVDDEDARLSAESDALATLAADLEQIRAEGRIDEYNAQLPAFNERVATYNTDVDNLQALVDDYNALVAERNLLAEEWAELREPIDTSLESVE